MNHIILDEKEIFPSKVVCIGRNYIEHIKELNNEVPEDMVFFIKPNSSISEKLVFQKDMKVVIMKLRFHLLSKRIK